MAKTIMLTLLFFFSRWLLEWEVLTMWVSIKHSTYWSSYILIILQKTLFDLFFHQKTMQHLLKKEDSISLFFAISQLTAIKNVCIYDKYISKTLKRLLRHILPMSRCHHKNDDTKWDSLLKQLNQRFLLWLFCFGNSVSYGFILFPGVFLRKWI